MAPNLTMLTLLLACLAGSCLADTGVDIPVTDHDLPVADITTASPTATSGSSDPAVSTPGETFSSDGDLFTFSTGVANGDPSTTGTAYPTGVSKVVAANTDPTGDLQADEAHADDVAAGKKRRASRKMLQLGTLDLSGGGVAAGDSEAGVAANAYGHGQLGDDVTDPTDKHIEPHGVDATVTTAGTATTVGAGADPDCTAALEGINEGDCVTAIAGR